MEAVILKQTRNRMRVVAPGLRDALELRRNSKGWVTENGDRFEFEFLAAATEKETVYAAEFQPVAGVARA